uniref:Uncharacterized protein n=1 Tax=Cacopsylla melanoneura TaxID=428564 RepID=A0A8D9EGB1_9HEMI
MLATHSLFIHNFHFSFKPCVSTSFMLIVNTNVNTFLVFWILSSERFVAISSYDHACLSSALFNSRHKSDYIGIRSRINLVLADAFTVGGRKREGANQRTFIDGSRCLQTS